MTLNRSTIVALICALIATPTGIALADGTIVVAAHETEIAVPPRPAHSKLVNLPQLEFALRAAIQCNGEPVSVTLSVADTYQTISRETLARARAAEAVLSVPPRQLALAANSHFCIAEDPESTNEMLVSGFATAHASLRCESGDKSSAHFASAPLQVRLRCERELQEDRQAPSEDAEPR
jgi:hypothetical protein